MSESQLRFELEWAIRDIQNGISPDYEVASFSYPYGDQNEMVRRVVSKYHESARGPAGINEANLSDQDFWDLKGVGVYPPYNMDDVLESVKKAIKTKNWVLVYFHSTGKLPGDTITPVTLFIKHIDDIQNLSDSLWIATQKEVIRYIRLRENATMNSICMGDTSVKMFLSITPDFDPKKTSLSFSMDVPEAWREKQVVVTHTITTDFQIYKNQTSMLILEITPSDTLTIFGQYSRKRNDME